MDPLTWLLEHAIAGKYGSIAVLIVIATIIARGLTKLEAKASALVAGVDKIGEGLAGAREDDRREHAATRDAVVRVERRVDELEVQVINAIGADGQLTREDLADRRVSDLRSKVESALEARPAALPEPPRRRAG